MSDYKALCERLRLVGNANSYTFAPAEASAAAFAIESLHKQLEEARADAERWQFMRNYLTHQRCGPTVGWGTDVLYPGDDPDEAIDAALQQQDEYRYDY